jgi:hypothetical protein
VALNSKVTVTPHPQNPTIPELQILSKSSWPLGTLGILGIVFVGNSQLTVFIPLYMKMEIINIPGSSMMD